jgi:hypothetical protein
MHRACLAAALAAAIAFAPPARAGSSAADRDAARTLAGKGYELFEAGQYQKAIELFQQAEGRFHAPPHLLYVGRAQVKLGKLVEAEATFQRILDEKLAADAPGPFKEAQTSARAELAEVEALVPSLTITVAGEAPAGVRYFVDGDPIDPTALGRPMKLNPGSHLISAEPPGQLAIERTVVLKLGGGDETRVALSFGRARGSVVPGAVLVSVGAVGIGVGVAGAVLAARAQSPSAPRIAEITGFAAGGAALVTGVVLLAVRPGGGSRAASSGAEVRVGLGLGALQLSGRF